MITDKTNIQGINKILNISDYRWIDEHFGIENPLFPNNYIAAVKHYNSNKNYNNVIIEPIPEVLEILKKEGLEWK